MYDIFSGMAAMSPDRQEAVFFPANGTDDHGGAAPLAGALLEGWIALSPQDEELPAQFFEGGWLVQGAPLNVWFGVGWFDGQRELLEPFWTSGEIPTPPAELLDAVTVQMPEHIAERHIDILTGRRAPEPPRAQDDTGLFSSIDTNMVLWGLAGLALIGIAISPRVNGAQDRKYDSLERGEF